MKEYLLNNTLDKDETINVLIGFEIENDEPSFTDTTEEYELKSGVVKYKVRSKNKYLSEDEINDYLLSKRQSRKIAREKRLKRLKSTADKFNQKMNWLHDESIREQINSGNRTLQIALTTKEISKVISKAAEFLIGIELDVETKNAISGAMISTGTLYAYDTSKYPNALGQGVGVYMTEAGCPEENFNNGFLQGYTRLSGVTDNHAENVSSIFRNISQLSYLYCRGGAVLPSYSDFDGVDGNPAILVATRSNGGTSNFAYTLLDRDWDNLVFEDNVITFLSAGNEGEYSGEVVSPGKGYNVITVGNYNDATNNIDSSSSASNSLLGNQKPEVVAPGVNIRAGGHRLSGTSMSAPHVAGMAANLVSYINKFSSIKPAMYKAWIMSGATNTISGGYNATGMGGIDFVDTINDVELGTATYPSSHFPRNSVFTLPRTIQNSTPKNDKKAVRVTVVASWLNDGDYAYANRNNGNALGKDFDIFIYDGKTVVYSSQDRLNSFEAIQFTLPTSSNGTYHVELRAISDTDLNTTVDIGYAINYETL